MLGPRGLPRGGPARRGALGAPDSIAGQMEQQLGPSFFGLQERKPRASEDETRPLGVAFHANPMPEFPMWRERLFHSSLIF